MIEYEDIICSNCNGSGEGEFDGTNCKYCKGEGVKTVEKDEVQDDTN